MAEFTLASASVKQVWSTNYIADYMRKSRFLPYMGRTNSSIFITKYELQTQSGKIINMPWVGALKGSGVYDNGVLEGKEEALPNSNFPISIHWIRKAVIASKNETYKTELDVMNINKDALQNWSARKLKFDIIEQGLGTATKTDNSNAPWVPVIDEDGSSVKTQAASADMNSWITTNSDRVIFGSSVANNTGTFSSSAGNVNTTTGKLTCSLITQMKLMARRTEGTTTSITPYMTEDGAEWFVGFAGANSFRDLKQDPTMTQANRDARERGVKTNPLFVDGDLVWDGVIIKEEPSIDVRLTNRSTFLIGAGGSSINVAPFFLCGAAAAGIAWGQKATPQSQAFDYKFRNGTAIEELRGTEKLNFNGLQNGLVTGFVSGAA